MSDAEPSSGVELPPAAALPSEVKELIRAYMLKFVIPSGVLLTLIAGALGFTVSGIARIEASSEAVKYTLVAATDAAKANVIATQAATQAAEARAKAIAIADALTTAKYTVDKILNGQFKELSTQLFAIPEFRTALGTVGQTELNAIYANIDTIARGGVLAAGLIQGGKLLSNTAGVLFDFNSGRVSFTNPHTVKFIPILSTISNNDSYITGACFVKKLSGDSFIIATSAMDTGGKVFPATDCAFVVIGAGS